MSNSVGGEHRLERVTAPEEEQPAGWKALDDPGLASLVTTQVEKIRAEIAQAGFCVVGCDELEILCPGTMFMDQQFRLLAEIAMREKWSFTFNPDGTVEFAPLDRPVNGSRLLRELPRSRVPSPIPPKT